MILKRKKAVSIIGILIIVFSLGCTNMNEKGIEGVNKEVYKRGIEFMEYMEQTKMIGEKEGLEMLDAISTDEQSSEDALFEDVLYILWIYHNLKSVESAEVEINAYWKKLGIETTVQEQYTKTRNLILEAKNSNDLQRIYDSVVRD